MRALLIAALSLASAAGAQVLDEHGIHTPGATIDEGGIHTPSGSIDQAGVHADSARRGTTILTNGGHRSVDCGGEALTVNGNSNVLDVVGCRAVTVAGNGNQLSIRFARPGRLSVIGNRNKVGWVAPRGVVVRVSNVGTRNAVSRTAG